MDFTKLTEYAVEAAIDGNFDFSGLSLKSSYDVALYPYNDIVTRAPYLSSAITGRVIETKEDGSVEEFTTVISAQYAETNEIEFNVWCGDVFIEGRLSSSDAQARIERIVSEGSWSAAVKRDIEKGLWQFYASHKPSNRCNFWSKWAREKTLCRHSAFFLKTIAEDNPNFTTELKEKLDSVLNGPSKKAPTRKKASSFGLEELAFRVPVLFEGDRGAGKTFAARAFAKTHKLPLIECAGHEGIESIDLLGHLIPNESGGLVWKDGPLSEAFRLAQTERVVLVLDEILRVPIRQLSILLTVLSPDEGNYKLRTGRVVSVIDGIAKEETLEVPLSNLCIVATTNVGAEYAVDDIDPALAERFIVIRKDSELSEMRKILQSVAKKNHIAATQVKLALDFYKKMLELQVSGQVAQTPTTRTMVRAFELADSNEDVKLGLKAQILLWVMRSSDGKPIAAQVSLLEKLIDRTFD